MKLIVDTIVSGETVRLKMGRLAAYEMTPNPSLEPTHTGMALGPLPGVVHHPSSGPSAIPAWSAQLKR